VEKSFKRPRVDKHDERVRGMFSAIAPRYDMLNHLLSLNIDRSWRRFTVRTLRPDFQSPAPILDVCTGTGDLALDYAKVAPTHPIIGVDFCEPMLEIARNKAAQKRLNVQFEEANALDLPFPDNQFQLVTIAFGLRNVSDTRKALSELVRVTIPGGRVGILEFSIPKTPLLGAAYRWYFAKLLPRIGQTLAPNQSSAYEYLPASVMEFLEGDDMLALMNEMGLQNSHFHRLTFGVATLYVGQKKNAVNSR
jgi:demethylmenaquinone methyltransferase/2-methoxy-6-polyprenyl-1,4-benzoquinol methylase